VPLEEAGSEGVPTAPVANRGRGTSPQEDGWGDGGGGMGLNRKARSSNQKDSRNVKEKGKCLNAKAEWCNLSAGC